MTKISSVLVIESKMCVGRFSTVNSPSGHVNQTYIQIHQVIANHGAQVVTLCSSPCLADIFSLYAHKNMKLFVEKVWWGTVSDLYRLDRDLVPQHSYAILKLHFSATN